MSSTACQTNEGNAQSDRNCRRDVQRPVSTQGKTGQPFEHAGKDGNTDQKVKNVTDSTNGSHPEGKAAHKGGSTLVRGEPIVSAVASKTRKRVLG